MKSKITYILIQENYVRVFSNRNTSFKGISIFHLNNLQIRQLRRYISTNDLKDLGELLNIKTSNLEVQLFLRELLINFSKNKNFLVIEDDRLKKKTIKNFNEWWSKQKKQIKENKK